MPASLAPRLRTGWAGYIDPAFLYTIPPHFPIVFLGIFENVGSHERSFPRARLLACAAFVLAAGTGFAQTAWPTKPMRAVNDLVGGQMPIAFESMSAVLAQLQAGKLRARGDEPETLAHRCGNSIAVEAGVPGYESIAWYGVVGPAGIPQRSWHASTARCAGCSRWDRRTAARSSSAPSYALRSRGGQSS